MDTFRDINWADMAVKVGIAIAILIVTWILARVVKWAFTKLVSRIGFLQRRGADGASLGESLGSIASLLVWLFGLVAILQVFSLDRVLEPITTMLTSILDYLPNIIAAGFVFFVGALIAKIVRELVQTTLSTVNFDRVVNRGGGDEVTGNPNISRTIATVVWGLIMIVVAIAALQILGIEAISEPAERMLTGIFDAIPNIIAAALILGIGLLIARFAGDLLEQVLSGLGTDRALGELGLSSRGRSASSVIAKIAQVAILLFFAVMAAQKLGFPQITEILREVLELGGKVLFGGAIIAVGFFVANLLARMVGSGLGTQVVRYATLALFIAMGLKYMGIADSIIELAFGAVVVGGALAAAIAFGLGGRDAAARTLDRVERRVESDSDSSGTGAQSAGTSAGTSTGTASGSATGTSTGPVSGSASTSTGPVSGSGSTSTGPGGTSPRD